MKYIVDRVEDEYIVLESTDGNMINIPRKLIPEALENDVITIEVDYEETKKRKEKIEELMARVFED